MRQRGGIFDRAGLGAQFAGNDVEQGRFAGAVAADQADARAGRDAGGGVFQQRAAGDADREVVDDEHVRLLDECGCTTQSPKGRILARLVRHACAGFALIDDQIETRRLLVADDRGQQCVRLAAVVGLVVEKMIERRRQRLFDVLRVDDGADSGLFWSRSFVGRVCDEVD